MAQASVSYVQDLLRQSWQRAIYFISQARKGLNNEYAPTSSLATDHETINDPERKPRYRLDDDTADTVTLPDGRKLGFATYGAPSGPSIFYLHGFPGSRSQAAVYEEPAEKLGIRIIAVDRPGAGLSTAQLARKALDHAEDIMHLARQLQIDRFAVLGVSGGGLYALACAKAIPRENLQAVALVAGIGPHDIGSKGMKSGNWLLFQGFRYWPSAVRWLLQKARAAMDKMSEDERLDLLQWQPRYRWLEYLGPPAKDLTVTRDRDFNRVMLKASREFGVNGVEGYMEEGRVFVTDCGFRIQDINPDLPVQLWYGKQDDNVPLGMGEEIAVRLGGRAVMKVEDETHLSLFMNSREEVLRELVECM